MLPGFVQKAIYKLFRVTHAFPDYPDNCVLANRRFVPVTSPDASSLQCFIQLPLSISFQEFDLEALSHAVSSAFAVRYCFAPSLLFISWLIVEGELDNLAEMSLKLRFATRPLDISSLSPNESANRCRFRTGGRYPAVW